MAVEAGTGGKITVDEARQLVIANASIADVTVLRDKAHSSPRLLPLIRERGFSFPRDVSVANRNAKISGLIEQLEENDSTYATSEIIATLRARWMLACEAEELFPNGEARKEFRDLRTKNLRKLPTNVNAVYNDKYDPMPYVFKEVFNPSEKTKEAAGTGLSREWMKIVDGYVEESSEENIDAIDKAAEVGEHVKKDLVIVGGGLLTSHAVSILAPYYNVTVITRDNRLVRNWRNRPIFINSSAENDYGPNLPLLTGTTTPIIGQDQLQYIDPSVLLGGDTLTVPCDDGTTREYVSGLELGKVAATNIVFGAEDYILGQEVDTKKVTINEDGTKRLTLVDEATGQKRELDADKVLFLTGPGEEVNKIQDEQSQIDYQKAKEQVKSQIALAREIIGTYNEQIDILQLSSDPASRDRIRELEKHIKGVRIELPRILSLTMIEDLYDFWQNDQESDPDAFPLKPIFESANGFADVIIAGGGDSAKTITELLTGQGPKGAYPDEQRPSETPRVLIYGLTQDAIDAIRRRYKGILEANVRAFSSKLKNLVLNNANSTYKVSVIREDGISNFKYGFVSTGIERRGLEEELFDIDVRFIKDLDGNRVGTGNAEQGVYIGASASGLEKVDFPQEIQNIIDGLGIPENTISAWVNSLLLERLLWTIVAEKGPNQEKLKALATVS